MEDSTDGQDWDSRKWAQAGDSDCADRNDFHRNHHPHLSPPTIPDDSREYMARSGPSQPMKHYWRAEGNPRERHHHPRPRARDRDRSPGSTTSPREEPFDRHRQRGRSNWDNSVSSRKGRHHEYFGKSHGRQPSFSPPRYSRPASPPPSRSRQFEDSSRYPRDYSPDRSPKRRRTKSSVSIERDRDSLDERDRNQEDSRGGIPDSRLPPPHSHQSDDLDPDSRSAQAEPFVHPDRRRGFTPDPRDRRSPSIISHPGSRAPSNRTRESSIGSNFPPNRQDRFKNRRSRKRRGNRPSRSPSFFDHTEYHSMDGQHPNRGNHGYRGQPRYLDSRQHGSPPFSSASNSSYHGSPPPNPQYNQRDGWGGGGGRGQYAQMQSSSPPYRQNSFSGPNNMNNPNPFPGNQHGYHGQSGYRGRGRGHHQGPDRRFNPNYRGRGGNYQNLQWTPPPTGAPTGPAAQSFQPSSANSVQPLSTPSQTPQDDGPPEEQHPFRPSKDPQAEDQRDNTRPTGPKYGNENQGSAASKFSFAFKPKPPPQGPAKTTADFAKPKGPFQPDSRPPQHPKNKFHDRRDDRPGPPRGPADRRFPNDRRFPPDRPPYPDRRPDRSRSPPPKKFKKEIKSRPVLPPEFAESESIYYRKPGNESVVGAGTYGKVFKAIHIYTKDQVALKKIRMEAERDGFPVTAVREIRLLQHLRHKHVVALQEVMVERNECFMVFEYLSHDLTGLINHPTFKLTPSHKKDLARQMFDGLDFLHRRGVLHRDIKAANILISNSGRLKYADFGLARFYTKSHKLDYTNRVITIWYRPPELLLGETQYGPEVDIWSAACVFVEMFTKKAIFPGEGGELSQLDKVYNVLGTPTRNDWPGIIDLPWFELMQPSDRRKRVFEAMFKDIFPAAALDLVQWMFKYDPNKRPNAAQVLAHDYFVTEEPKPVQAVELADVEGDWHEFESKAHRRENDKREKEKKKEEYMRDREKRKAREAGLSESRDDTDAAPAEKKSRQNRHPGSGPPDSSNGGGDVAEATADMAREDESEGEGSARMSMS
ncbi:hypothetical protein PV10_06588 [Exophiala mesophila]|uniref:cyclin-dependent kinase n=1 Tax=Exophiala mesophila TaxID=212818 RepID=A0A0D1ZZ58_EXOME|nr:uncharacterized protein PV10_06588 [Exophiala mesophila]KIV92123.1 hypothetical protein PV10_06588 [Exophiala mesophila]